MGVQLPPLWERRTIWLPSWFGCTLGVVTLGLLSLTVLLRGEPFLSRTSRVPADLLIVEAWIGARAMDEVVAEFELGRYDTVMVAATTAVGDRWDLATVTKQHLVLRGVPSERIIEVHSPRVARHRTFNLAVHVWQALRDRNMTPRGVNVMTMTVHARRSRLVFQRVLEKDIAVGVVAWTPPVHAPHWWHSSEQTVEFLKESVAYTFELLFYSGRFGRDVEALGHL